MAEEAAEGALKPIARYAIWAVSTLVAIGVAVGGVLLTMRNQAAPPPVAETLQSVQTDVPGPRLPAADATFNGTGVAALTGGVGRDVAVDETGRIVVLGRAGIDRVPRLAVWRLTPEGRMDSTFGAGGVSLVPSSFPPGTKEAAEFGQALAIDGKGRIVIAGYIQDPQGRLRASVWRLTFDGSPDAAFHGNGRVAFGGSSQPGSDDTGKAVVIDPRGRIVVAGSSWPVSEEGQIPREHLVVWRLADGGQLDRTFHGSGILTVPDTRANVLAVDSASRVLVAGATLGPRAAWSLAVWRFLSDGSADPDWNGGAVLTPQLAEPAFHPTVASGLAVAPDGKVVVLGVVYDPRRLSDVDDYGIQQIGLWRFLPDGTPDPAFNPRAGGGVVITGTAGGQGAKAGDFGRAIALDSLGRIVVSGSSRDRQGRRLLAVWRRTPSGLADATLGSGGASVQGNAPGADEGPNAVAVGMAPDAQGRVVVAGALTAEAKTCLAVWRIKP